jgi:thiol:disulfide interchange protein DsbD
VGPLRWPAPHAFSESDGLLTTYGYGEPVLLWNDVLFASGSGESGSGEHPAARQVAVVADLLVCEVRCIPARMTLERTVVVGDAAAPPDPEVRALFDAAAAREPRPAADLDLEVQALYSQDAIRPGDPFRAALAVLSCAGVDEDCSHFTIGAHDARDAFIPDLLDTIELEVTGQRAHPLADDGFLITLAGRASPDSPPGGTHAVQRLRGVLALEGPAGPAWAEVDVPFPRAAPGTAVTPIANPWLEPSGKPQAGLPLWQAFLLALLGGVILNAMPCVLPVLAIKVFGIAELAQRGRRELRTSGLVYTAGIGVTMAALAAVVTGLRAAGTAVGWGFQFQEPLFVAAIGAVLLVFALNLFGVFDFNLNATRLSRVGAQASGHRRSFFEGLLCVVVATPCSAPFLGTAVGFAFASSTPVIFAIFGAIGLGLAAPYLVVSWIPAWARLIPRSGPWMIHLRRVLGFALLATVLWLVWVMGRSVGIDGAVALLAFLLVLAMATWAFGTVQAAGNARAALASGTLALAVGLGGLALLPRDLPPATGEASAADGVRAFERSAVAAELALGNPVFVYFTADWCLTCKVNEGTVLTDSRVRTELGRLGIATFRADWTRRDERIRAELARFGRAGVPMYLVYSPGAPNDPELLPELLSVDRLLEALRQAARGTPQTRLSKGG